MTSATGWLTTIVLGLPQDWPTYNHDVAGTRCNAAETTISPKNAGQLLEKWRFPAAGSGLEIGVIHATPVVVDGCVYFGTVTDATFYALAPDGTLRWTYRNPAYPKDPPPALPDVAAARTARFQSSPSAILGSALVNGDTVFFADLGGWIYALDRATGAERWKVDTRAATFPGAHPMNLLIASPILADGRLIVAGGTIEQVIAAFPEYHGCTGRGFVAALDPASGRTLWKYDVGPEPKLLTPPITIHDEWGDHVFYYGPATSSVWCTPSFDAATGTLYFGTDVNTSPRWPTPDDPRTDTGQSCAVIALDVVDGAEVWVTQINSGDVWTNAMRGYDPATGKYKDQSIGDTPKIYTIQNDGQNDGQGDDGKPTKVVGVGCKNGGFYVLDAAEGTLLAQTPIFTGPPKYPLTPQPDPRMVALPSIIGGLQTGCATDGHAIFTNGIDALFFGSQTTPQASGGPPTGGRVVALSPDTRQEFWRHERPKVASMGGPPPKPVFTDVGDPIASGIAVANGVLYFTTVASGKLVVLDAGTGALLKEIALGPVWSGPSVARGRVYVGTGNTLFTPGDAEAFFPKLETGVLHSFGLPGEDAVDRMGSGRK